MSGGALFGYNAPSGVAYTLTGGATFTTDVVLDNSSPADVTQFTWATSGATTCTLQANWSTAIVPRVACLLGVSLPVGMGVTIKGKRSGDTGFPYALGGNSQTSTVVQFDDGSSGIIWIFDAGLTAILGYEITMVPSGIAGSQLISIGEARILQAYQPGRGIQTKWAPNIDGLLTPSVTVNRQPHVINHRYNRTDSIVFGVANEKAAWLSDTGQISFNRFALIAATRQTLLVIPVAYQSGSISPLANNSAIYGYSSKLERPQFVDNHYYQMAMSFSEYPPAQYG